MEFDGAGSAPVDAAWRRGSLSMLGAETSQMHFIRSNFQAMKLRLPDIWSAVVAVRCAANPGFVLLVRLHHRSWRRMQRFVLVLLSMIATTVHGQCPRVSSADSTLRLGDGRVVTLGALSVWRDFMPISDSVSTMLRAVVELRLPGDTIARTTRVTGVWVRRDSVWTTLPELWRNPVDAAGRVTVLASRGPLWPLRTFIDLVVLWEVAPGQNRCTFFPRLAIDASY